MTCQHSKCHCKTKCSNCSCEKTYSVGVDREKEQEHEIAPSIFSHPRIQIAFNSARETWLNKTKCNIKIKPNASKWVKERVKAYGPFITIKKDSTHIFAQGTKLKQNSSLWMGWFPLDEIEITEIDSNQLNAIDVEENK